MTGHCYYLYVHLLCMLIIINNNLVAMTRPKRHLCVICDSETLSGIKAKASRSDGGFLRRWMDWLSEESDLRFSEQCI